MKKAKVLEPHQKQYIIDHSTDRPQRIACELGICVRLVTECLEEQGLRKIGHSRQSPLNKEQRTFIREHSATMRANEIANFLGVEFSGVYRYISKQRLPTTPVMTHIEFTKPKEVSVFQSKKYSRPPAEYSNPDWSTMYLND